MKKLGIKAGYRLYVHEPPLDYFDWLHPSPTDVEIAQKISGKFNFIHVTLIITQSLPAGIDSLAKAQGYGTIL